MVNLRALAGKINRRKVAPIGLKETQDGQWKGFDGEAIDSQHLLISMLLPPAVKQYLEELEKEVTALCGKRYQHGTANQRWGSQEGSIFLGNQKIRIERPRVRNVETGKEVGLEQYERFQDPNLFDQTVFEDGLRKVSQRDYAKGVQKIASSFGFEKSSVSRRWVKATEKRLAELNDRDIGSLGIMALVIDGKRFSSRGVVVVMGIAESGKKYVLGIYECSTENSDACKSLLSALERRGLPDRNLIVVVDGGSGLNKALEEKYDIDNIEKRRAVRIRCYKHKWGNIESNLSEEEVEKAKPMFWSIREAKTLDVARHCSLALEDFLRQANRSALDSYLDAKEDLLNIHRLNMSALLRSFFSTTNAIESLNYLLEEDLRRVKHWHDSAHFQRWLAASCLNSEKRMRRVHGYKGLAAVKVAIDSLCCKDYEIDNGRRFA